MPFGIISRTGPGIRQVMGFGDRSTEGVHLGTNLERVIVTNGDFTAYVCDATRPSSQITLGRLVLVALQFKLDISTTRGTRFTCTDEHGWCVSNLRTFIAV